ncbi:Nucleotide-binding universal stress protein, UspA family [Saccharopolyspora shandongensis]|uniref:Nucleotide-binding universal stress protein, UspA family n=1 Tax=Saccharopolyspora shandongensis TaxID=418495 RepID=A0A1H3QY08_9PSEU|nr:universal stress protein [Saccharopolyspora shandongensis]SDZ18246.1 Nucleotide-binding universal stress protein, UspA family [Saccharopolyspora shandongensis]
MPEVGHAVVVGLDASKASRHAAGWAAREAASRRRPLLLVHVFPRPLLELTRFRQPGTAEPHEPLQQAMCRELSTVLQQCLQIAPGLEICTEMISGDPVEVLARKSEHAELLVVGSSGIGSPDLVLVGSTAAELLTHQTGAPVVITRGADQAGQESPQVVVVGVDGSSNSVRAVDFASRHHCRLVAVHAWSDLPLDYPQAWVLDHDEAHREASELLSRSLSGYAERYPDVLVREVVTVQRPAQALVEASRGAGLLVVGSRGRGPVRRAVLGSVSHAVVHAAPCTVAVLRG